MIARMKNSEDMERWEWEGGRVPNEEPSQEDASPV